MVNKTGMAAGWRTCASIDLDLDTRRLWLEIPTGFTDIQSQAPEIAMSWRMQTRDVFETYFKRGFRAVDFVLNRTGGFGRYLLAREEAENAQ